MVETPSPNPNHVPSSLPLREYSWMAPDFQQFFSQYLRQTLLANPIPLPSEWQQLFHWDSLSLIPVAYTFPVLNSQEYKTEIFILINADQLEVVFPTALLQILSHILIEDELTDPSPFKLATISVKQNSVTVFDPRLVFAMAHDRPPPYENFFNISDPYTGPWGELSESAFYEYLTSWRRVCGGFFVECSDPTLPELSLNLDLTIRGDQLRLLLFVSQIPLWKSFIFHVARLRAYSEEEHAEKASWLVKFNQSEHAMHNQEFTEAEYIGNEYLVGQPYRLPDLTSHISVKTDSYPSIPKWIQSSHDLIQTFEQIPFDAQIQSDPWIWRKRTDSPDGDMNFLNDKYLNNRLCGIEATYQDKFQHFFQSYHHKEITIVERGQGVWLWKKSNTLFSTYIIMKILDPPYCYQSYTISTQTLLIVLGKVPQNAKIELYSAIFDKNLIRQENWDACQEVLNDWIGNNDHYLKDLAFRVASINSRDNLLLRVNLGNVLGNTFVIQQFYQHPTFAKNILGMWVFDEESKDFIDAMSRKEFKQYLKEVSKDNQAGFPCRPQSTRSESSSTVISTTVINKSQEKGTEVSSTTSEKVGSTQPLSSIFRLNLRGQEEPCKLNISVLCPDILYQENTSKIQHRQAVYFDLASVLNNRVIRSKMNLLPGQLLFQMLISPAGDPVPEPSTNPKDSPRTQVRQIRKEMRKREGKSHDQVFLLPALRRSTASPLIIDPSLNMEREILLHDSHLDSFLTNEQKTKIKTIYLREWATDRQSRKTKRQNASANHIHRRIQMQEYRKKIRNNRDQLTDEDWSEFIQTLHRTDHPFLLMDLATVFHVSPQIIFRVLTSKSKDNLSIKRTRNQNKQSTDSSQEIIDPKTIIAHFCEVLPELDLWKGLEQELKLLFKNEPNFTAKIQELVQSILEDFMGIKIVEPAQYIQSIGQLSQTYHISPDLLDSLIFNAGVEHPQNQTLLQQIESILHGFKQQGVDLDAKFAFYFRPNPDHRYIRNISHKTPTKFFENPQKLRRELDYVAKTPNVLDIYVDRQDTKTSSNLTVMGNHSNGLTEVPEKTLKQSSKWGNPEDITEVISYVLDPLAIQSYEANSILLNVRKKYWQEIEGDQAAILQNNPDQPFNMMQELFIQIEQKFLTAKGVFLTQDRAFTEMYQYWLTGNRPQLLLQSVTPTATEFDTYLRDLFQLYLIIQWELAFFMDKTTAPMNQNNTHYMEFLALVTGQPLPAINAMILQQQNQMVSTLLANNNSSIMSPPTSSSSQVNVAQILMGKTKSPTEKKQKSPKETFQSFYFNMITLRDHGIAIAQKLSLKPNKDQIPVFSASTMRTFTTITKSMFKINGSAEVMNKVIPPKILQQMKDAKDPQKITKLQTFQRMKAFIEDLETIAQTKNNPEKLNAYFADFPFSDLINNSSVINVKALLNEAISPSNQNRKNAANRITQILQKRYQLNYPLNFAEMIRKGVNWIFEIHTFIASKALRGFYAPELPAQNDIFDTIANQILLSLAKQLAWYCSQIQSLATKYFAGAWLEGIGYQVKKNLAVTPYSILNGKAQKTELLRIFTFEDGQLLHVEVSNPIYTVGEKKEYIDDLYLRISQIPNLIRATKSQITTTRLSSITSFSQLWQILLNSNPEASSETTDFMQNTFAITTNPFNSDTPQSVVLELFDSGEDIGIKQAYLQWLKNSKIRYYNPRNEEEDEDNFEIESDEPEKKADNTDKAEKSDDEDTPAGVMTVNSNDDPDLSLDFEQLQDQSLIKIAENADHTITTTTLSLNHLKDAWFRIVNDLNTTLTDLPIQMTEAKDWREKHECLKKMLSIMKTIMNMGVISNQQNPSCYHHLYVLFDWYQGCSAVWRNHNNNTSKLIQNWSEYLKSVQEFKNEFPTNPFLEFKKKHKALNSPNEVHPYLKTPIISQESDISLFVDPPTIITHAGAWLKEIRIQFGKLQGQLIRLTENTSFFKDDTFRYDLSFNLNLDPSSEPDPVLPWFKGLSSWVCQVETGSGSPSESPFRYSTISYYTILTDLMKLSEAIITRWKEYCKKPFVIFLDKETSLNTVLTIDTQGVLSNISSRDFCFHPLNQKETFTRFLTKIRQWFLIPAENILQKLQLEWEEAIQRAKQNCQSDDHHISRYLEGISCQNRVQQVRNNLTLIRRLVDSKLYQSPIATQSNQFELQINFKKVFGNPIDPLYEHPNYSEIIQNDPSTITSLKPPSILKVRLLKLMNAEYHLWQCTQTLKNRTKVSNLNINQIDQWFQFFDVKPKKPSPPQNFTSYLQKENPLYSQTLDDVSKDLHKSNFLHNRISVWNIKDGKNQTIMDSTFKSTQLAEIIPKLADYFKDHSDPKMTIRQSYRISAYLLLWRLLIEKNPNWDVKSSEELRGLMKEWKETLNQFKKTKVWKETHPSVKTHIEKWLESKLKSAIPSDETKILLVQKTPSKKAFLSPEYYVEKYFENNTAKIHKVVVFTILNALMASDSFGNTYLEQVFRKNRLGCIDVQYQEYILKKHLGRSSKKGNKGDYEDKILYSFYEAPESTSKLQYNCHFLHSILDDGSDKALIITSRLRDNRYQVQRESFGYFTQMRNLYKGVPIISENELPRFLIARDTNFTHPQFGMFLINQYLEKIKAIWAYWNYESPLFFSFITFLEKLDFYIPLIIQKIQQYCITENLSSSSSTDSSKLKFSMNLTLVNDPTFVDKNTAQIDTLLKQIKLIFLEIGDFSDYQRSRFKNSEYFVQKEGENIITTEEREYLNLCSLWKSLNIYMTNNGTFIDINQSIYQNFELIASQCPYQEVFSPNKRKIESYYRLSQMILKMGELFLGDMQENIQNSPTILFRSDGTIRMDHSWNQTYPQIRSQHPAKIIAGNDLNLRFEPVNVGMLNEDFEPISFSDSEVNARQTIQDRFTQNFIQNKKIDYYAELNQEKDKFHPKTRAILTEVNQIAQVLLKRNFDQQKYSNTYSAKRDKLAQADSKNANSWQKRSFQNDISTGSPWKNIGRMVEPKRERIHGIQEGIANRRTDRNRTVAHFLASNLIKFTAEWMKYHWNTSIWKDSFFRKISLTDIEMNSAYNMLLRFNLEQILNYTASAGDPNADTKSQWMRSMIPRYFREYGWVRQFNVFTSVPPAYTSKLWYERLISSDRLFERKREGDKGYIIRIQQTPASNDLQILVKESPQVKTAIKFQSGDWIRKKYRLIDTIDPSFSKIESLNLINYRLPSMAEASILRKVHAGEIPMNINDGSNLSSNWIYYRLGSGNLNMVLVDNLNGFLIDRDNGASWNIADYNPFTQPSENLLLQLDRKNKNVNVTKTNGNIRKYNRKLWQRFVEAGLFHYTKNKTFYTYFHWQKEKRKGQANPNEFLRYTETLEESLGVLIPPPRTDKFHEIFNSVEEWEYFIKETIIRTFQYTSYIDQWQLSNPKSPSIDFDQLDILEDPSENTKIEDLFKIMKEIYKKQWDSGTSLITSKKPKLTAEYIWPSLNSSDLDWKKQWMQTIQDCITEKTGLDRLVLKQLFSEGDLLPYCLSWQHTFAMLNSFFKFKKDVFGETCSPKALVWSGLFELEFEHQKDEK